MKIFPVLSLVVTTAVAIEQACGVDYEGFYNQVNIDGKDFDYNVLGANGENLLAQLRGCGAVTDWSFVFTGGRWDWHAACHLPIGTKGCVGRALKTAGGDSDQCAGSA